MATSTNQHCVVSVPTVQFPDDISNQRPVEPLPEYINCKTECCSLFKILPTTTGETGLFHWSDRIILFAETSYVGELCMMQIQL